MNVRIWFNPDPFKIERVGKTVLIKHGDLQLKVKEEAGLVYLQVHTLYAPVASWLVGGLVKVTMRHSVTDQQHMARIARGRYEGKNFSAIVTEEIRGLKYGYQSVLQIEASAPTLRRMRRKMISLLAGRETPCEEYGRFQPVSVEV